MVESLLKSAEVLEVTNVANVTGAAYRKDTVSLINN